ncbi:hypothetical protein EJB05_36145, partial [Eragrostis curvula]
QPSFSSRARPLEHTRCCRRRRSDGSAPRRRAHHPSSIRWASDLLHGKRRRGRGSRSGAEGRCTERDHDHQRIRLRLPFLQIIMARRPLATRTRRRNMTLRNILTSVLLMYYYVWLLMALAYRRKCLKIERRLRIKERRAENLNDLIGSDTKCISELRMDRRTFYILCEMVRDVGGLKATRNMTLEEIVAQFLYYIFDM